MGVPWIKFHQLSSYRGAFTNCFKMPTYLSVIISACFSAFKKLAIPISFLSKHWGDKNQARFQLKTCQKKRWRLVPSPQLQLGVFGRGDISSQNWQTACGRLSAQLKISNDFSWRHWDERCLIPASIPVLRRQLKFNNATKYKLGGGVAFIFASTIKLLLYCLIRRR